MIDEPNGSSRRVRLGWGEIFWVTLLFTAVLVLLAYPISVHPRSLRFPTGPDGDLGIYLMGWNTHAFTHRPWAIFDANIYYPARYTLAFGENVIGIAFFAAPVIWLTGDLMLATNFVCLLSCVLSGLGAYVLARRVGLGIAAAIICGLIFEASPPRFFRIGQMNLSSVYWIPFALAALHAYFDEGRKRDLRLAIGFFTLQVLASGHGAVFAVVAVAGFLFYRLALGEPIQALKRLRDFGVPGALLLLPSILVFLPYRVVQREAGLRRGLGSWGVTPESWLASPSHLHKYLLHLFGADGVNQAANAFLFPGYLPLFLAAVALVWMLWLAVRGVARWFADRAGRRVAVKAGGTAPPRGDLQVATAGSSGVAVARATARATAWRAAAIALEAALFVTLVVAVILTVTEPIKWRVGKTVIFSSRGSGRAWLWCAGLFAARLAVQHFAPLRIGARLSGAWSVALAAGRGLGTCLSRAMGWLAAPLVHRGWMATVAAWGARRRRDVTFCYAFLTLLAFALAMGPPYGPWRYVYAWPGFSFIRANTRFTLLAMLGLAMLAAIGFERLTAKARPAWRNGLGALAAVVLVAEFAAMPMYSAPNNVIIPAIDRWLDTCPKPFVVAEVPTRRTTDRNRYEAQQSAYMLHSTAHYQKTVHGYSGWRLSEHEALYEHLLDFPTQATLDELQSFDVTYIVVHTDDYEPGEWPAVEARIEQFYPRLRFEHSEGAGRVYSLHRAGAAKGTGTN